MPEHDVAQCPICDKHDLVLKEDGYWVCLNPKCNYSEKMPHPEPDTDWEGNSNSGVFSMLVAALIVVMFMMVALGV